MLGLLAQYLGRKVAELGPEGLLQFFALGFFGRAILGVLRAQRCDLGLGRGAECRQFRFGTRSRASEAWLSAASRRVSLRQSTRNRATGTARLHVAANMKRVVGVIVCFCVCFHAKIAIYSRKNTPYRGMCVNLAPQRNF